MRRRRCKLVVPFQFGAAIAAVAQWPSCGLCSTQPQANPPACLSVPAGSGPGRRIAKPVSGRLDRPAMTGTIALLPPEFRPDAGVFPHNAVNAIAVSEPRGRSRHVKSRSPFLSVLKACGLHRGPDRVGLVCLAAVAIGNGRAWDRSSAPLVNGVTGFQHRLEIRRRAARCCHLWRRQSLLMAASITPSSSSNNSIVGPASMPPAVRSSSCLRSRRRCARKSSSASRFFRLKYPSTINFMASDIIKSADQNTRLPNGRRAYRSAPLRPAQPHLITFKLRRCTASRCRLRFR